MKTGKFIYQQPTKNIGEFKIPLVMEIHQSLFLEDFRNYEIRDFLEGGRVFEEPEILDGEVKVIDKISKKYYVVSPFHQKVFDNGHVLGGYVYLVDSPNGIDIYHREPVKNTLGNGK